MLYGIIKRDPDVANAGAGVKVAFVVSDQRGKVNKANSSDPSFDCFQITAAAQLRK
jgi:hypothetical protein